MSNGEYFVEYKLHGHMLFKVCEASGRPPPSYRFIKHDGKTTVEVTVGDEGPVEAGPYEHSWRSKGEAIDTWLMKYLPSWFELKVWEASDFKSMTPTLHFYCKSGQVDKVKAALSELQKKQQSIRGKIEEKQGTLQENQDMLEYNKEKLGEI